MQVTPHHVTGGGRGGAREIEEKKTRRRREEGWKKWCACCRHTDHVTLRHIPRRAVRRVTSRARAADTFGMPARAMPFPSQTDEKGSEGPSHTGRAERALWTRSAGVRSRARVSERGRGASDGRERGRGLGWRGRGEASLVESREIEQSETTNKCLLALTFSRRARLVTHQDSPAPHAPPRRAHAARRRRRRRQPIPGVQATLITRDIETPYSGANGTECGGMEWNETPCSGPPPRAYSSLLSRGVSARAPSPLAQGVDTRAVRAVERTAAV